MCDDQHLSTSIRLDALHVEGLSWESATAQFDLVIPTFLESDNKSTRLSLFYDIGNVFEKPGDFAVGELRSSAGISGSFFTPFLGLLQLSYSYPINKKPGDETDQFQISFGSGF